MLDRGKKALTKVAEWLEAGAPHVDVNGITLVEFDMNVSIDDRINGCGTACCIAGAVSQFEGLFRYDPYEDDGQCEFFWTKDAIDGDPEFGKNIREYLGLTKSQGDKLFIPWDHFSHGSICEFSDPSRAAKVIRHLIATGEVDWDEFDT